MILVTLGTIIYPFERAVSWLERLVETDIIQENVILQHGSTPTTAIRHPLIQCASSFSSQEIRQYAREASFVISHAGQGSTRMLIQEGARFVLLPRLKKFGEHIDNHQLLFAQAVSELGIPFCLELDSLSETLVNPPDPYRGNYFQETPLLVDHLIARYGRRRQSTKRTLATNLSR